MNNNVALSEYSMTNQIITSNSDLNNYTSNLVEVNQLIEPSKNQEEPTNIVHTNEEISDKSMIPKSHHIEKDLDTMAPQHLKSSTVDTLQCENDVQNIINTPTFAERANTDHNTSLLSKEEIESFNLFKTRPCSVNIQQADESSEKINSFGTGTQFNQMKNQLSLLLENSKQVSTPSDILAYNTVSDQVIQTNGSENNLITSLKQQYNNSSLHDRDDDDDDSKRELLTQIKQLIDNYELLKGKLDQLETEKDRVTRHKLKTEEAVASFIHEYKQECRTIEQLEGRLNLITSKYFNCDVLNDMKHLLEDELKRQAATERQIQTMLCSVFATLGQLLPDPSHRPFNSDDSVNGSVTRLTDWINKLADKWRALNEQQLRQRCEKEELEVVQDRLFKSLKDELDKQRHEMTVEYEKSLRKTVVEFTESQVKLRQEELHEKDSTIRELDQKLKTFENTLSQASREHASELTRLQHQIDLSTRAKLEAESEVKRVKEESDDRYQQQIKQHDQLISSMQSRLIRLAEHVTKTTKLMVQLEHRKNELEVENASLKTQINGVWQQASNERVDPVNTTKPTIINTSISHIPQPTQVVKNKNNNVKLRQRDRTIATLRSEVTSLREKLSQRDKEVEVKQRAELLQAIECGNKLSQELGAIRLENSQLSSQVKQYRQELADKEGALEYQSAVNVNLKDELHRAESSVFEISEVLVQSKMWGCACVTAPNGDHSSSGGPDVRNNKGSNEITKLNGLKETTRSLDDTELDCFTTVTSPDTRGDLTCLAKELTQIKSQQNVSNNTRKQVIAQCATDTLSHHLIQAIEISEASYHDLTQVLAIQLNLPSLQEIQPIKGRIGHKLDQVKQQRQQILTTIEQRLTSLSNELQRTTELVDEYFKQPKQPEKSRFRRACTLTRPRSSALDRKELEVEDLRQRNTRMWKELMEMRRGSVKRPGCKSGQPNSQSRPSRESSVQQNQKLVKGENKLFNELENKLKTCDQTRSTGDTSKVDKD